MININNANFPYLYLNSGREYLLYSTNKKLKVLDIFHNMNIDVKTPKSHPEYGTIISETHPHVSLNNEYKIRLSYIAGFLKNDNIKYYLVYLDFNDWLVQFSNSEICVVVETTTGFVNKNQAIYYAGKLETKSNTGLIKIKNLPVNTENTIEISGIEEILNINQNNDYNQYYITVKKYNRIHSFFCNKNFKIEKEILYQNQILGYCSFLQNILVYFKNNDLIGVKGFKL
jgi:hypothetical protein